MPPPRRSKARKAKDRRSAREPTPEFLDPGLEMSEPESEFKPELESLSSSDDDDKPPQAQPSDDDVEADIRAIKDSIEVDDLD